MIKPTLTAMASKTKNTKATQEPFPLAHMILFATAIGNQEYVPEPPHYKEKL